MADPVDLSGIDTDWILLTGRVIGGDPAARMDMVLLHPMLGVVLVQFAPRWTEDAPVRLRRELDKARFAAVFHGYPPVVHLSVPQEDVLDLPARAITGFTHQWPLTLRGGRDWLQAVEDVLQPAPPVPLAAPEPVAAAKPSALRIFAMAALVVALPSLAGLAGFGLARMLEPPQTPCECHAAAVPPAPPPVAFVPPLAPPVVPDAPPALPAPPSLAALGPPPEPLPPLRVVEVPPPAPVPPVPSPVPEAVPPVPVGSPAARFVATEEQIEQLLRRGRDLAQRGDFSGARLFFERAGNADSAEGALAAGRTYEPDAQAAEAWYRRAEDLRNQRN